MNKALVLIFLSVLSLRGQKQDARRNCIKTTIVENRLEDESLKTLSIRFNSLNILIRDQKISGTAALAQIQQIIPRIKTAYFNQYKKDRPAAWHFPLPGYSSGSIGGSNGSGYISKGYDYFDGDRHKAHPAQDIFIRDKNQDCKDDQTGQYVPVVSLTGGVVVALEKEWSPASSLRGGRYAWVYDPLSNSLFYYAHNNQLSVSLGQILQPGDTIATVGRSGFNAYKKRSPTHLHITQLRFDARCYPKPVNLYPALLKAVSKVFITFKKVDRTKKRTG